MENEVFTIGPSWLKLAAGIIGGLLMAAAAIALPVVVYRYRRHRQTKRRIRIAEK